MAIIIIYVRKSTNPQRSPSVCEGLARAPRGRPAQSWRDEPSVFFRATGFFLQWEQKEDEAKKKKKIDGLYSTRRCAALLYCGITGRCVSPHQGADVTRAASRQYSRRISFVFCFILIDIVYRRRRRSLFPSVIIKSIDFYHVVMFSVSIWRRPTVNNNNIKIVFLLFFGFFLAPMIPIYFVIATQRQTCRDWRYVGCKIGRGQIFEYKINLFLYIDVHYDVISIGDFHDVGFLMKKHHSELL